MSRIQNILEKAERDGSVRRARPMTETAAATALAFDVSGDASPVRSDSLPVAASPAPRVVKHARFDPNLVAVLAPGAPAAEQYRALRTRIARADLGSAMDVILVTSPGRGEGKSLTAANLALTMAQDFQTRVCVVDANLRHPSLHGLLGVSDTPGLADVLSGSAALADAVVRFEDQSVAFLPAGHPPSHPAEMLGSTAMRRTLEILRTQFDRIVIDAPSAGPLADIGILAPMVDGVLLVVRAGVTTKPSIQEAVATIASDKLLGVVLNESVA